MKPQWMVDHSSEPDFPVWEGTIECERDGQIMCRDCAMRHDDEEQSE